MTIRKKTELEQAIFLLKDQISQQRKKITKEQDVLDGMITSLDLLEGVTALKKPPAKKKIDPNLGALAA